MDRLDKLITERKQHMNIIKFEDLPISDEIKEKIKEFMTKNLTTMLRI